MRILCEGADHETRNAAEFREAAGVSGRLAAGARENKCGQLHQAHKQTAVARRYECLVGGALVAAAQQRDQQRDYAR